MADQIVTSFESPNYSGLLFNKGQAKTPFSSMLFGKNKYTSSVEFVTGQEYATQDGSQPNISEEASLNAPPATFTKRDQKTNVTQIFHKSVGISYAKESNMGTLSGVNIAGQQANPQNELDFQIGIKMQEIANDIEYTAINGVFQRATNDQTANKTRGMLSAIESNVVDLNGEPVSIWWINDLMKSIYDNHAPIYGLALWVDAMSLNQINADAQANGMTVMPPERNVNGIQITKLLTPLGVVELYLGVYLPAGTVGLFNFDVISPVEMSVPGKGNFFLEDLAKTGAGTKKQIFGQFGLDHGPEWFHGKLINAATEFVKPKSGIKMYVTEAVPTVDVLPELVKATIEAPANLATAIAAPVLEYKGIPSEAATLAYQWQEGVTAIGSFTNIAGATSATYTPTGKGGKFIKVKVTASGTATGSVLSNAKKMPTE